MDALVERDVDDGLAAFGHANQPGEIVLQLAAIDGRLRGAHRLLRIVKILQGDDTPARFACDKFDFGRARQMQGGRLEGCDRFHFES